MLIQSSKKYLFENRSGRVPSHVKVVRLQDQMLNSLREKQCYQTRQAASGRGDPGSRLHFIMITLYWVTSQGTLYWSHFTADTLYFVHTLLWKFYYCSNVFFCGHTVIVALLWTLSYYDHTLFTVLNLPLLWPYSLYYGQVFFLVALLYCSHIFLLWLYLLYCGGIFFMTLLSFNVATSITAKLSIL